jgi:hypothetical protein
LLELLLGSLLLPSVLTVAFFLHAPCYCIFGVPVVNGALQLLASLLLLASPLILAPLRVL